MKYLYNSQLPGYHFSYVLGNNGFLKHIGHVTTTKILINYLTNKCKNFIGASSYNSYKIQSIPGALFHWALLRTACRSLYWLAYPAFFINIMVGEGVVKYFNTIYPNIKKMWSTHFWDQISQINFKPVNSFEFLLLTLIINNTIVLKTLTSVTDTKFCILP